MDRVFHPAWNGSREGAAYIQLSRLGSDSANPWIRKSAAIPGWIFRGEHEYLWELACRACPGHVLEIGAWMGKSTCILAGACIETAPDTRVICVDPFDMRGSPEQERYHRRLVPVAPGTFYQLIENAKRSGFYDWVIPVGTVSRVALPALRLPFRLVFVDGAHDYQSARDDVELSLPLLTRGGLLALHDAANSSMWPDVNRFVQTELMHDQRVSFFGEGNTIVVFQKR